MFRSCRSCLALAGVLAVTAGIAFAAQHAVGQKDRLFSPGRLTVKSGEAVTFVNDDNVTHHLYSSTKLHPGMRLMITIQ